MNFLCPSCRTPLPTGAPEGIVPCTQCGVEVDLTRVDTAPGTARLWPDVDLAGEALGGYSLGRRLAAGGMGVVYEAEGPQGRCAIKVLSALLAAEPELRTRFRREAAALRAIDTPGVVRIFAEGEERGFCFYAMERVDGDDLRARLERGPLVAREVEALARSLLGTLAAVHEKGFVHRDLKPGNVLLSPRGPKLCDFGIARFDGSSTLTESAAVLGSLRYMAPEQRLGRATALSDLYALGILLHEALSGGVPGEKDLPAGVPRRLRRLLEALTAERVEHRPASARRALALLDRPSARPAALAAGVASLLALALAGAWLLRGPAADSPKGAASKASADPPRAPPSRPAQVQAMQGASSEGLAPQAFAPVEPDSPPAPRTISKSESGPGALEGGPAPQGAKALRSPLETAKIAPAVKGASAPGPKKTSKGESLQASATPSKALKAAAANGAAAPGDAPARQVSNMAQEMELQQFAPSKVKPWRKTSVKQVELQPEPAPGL